MIALLFKRKISKVAAPFRPLDRSSNFQMQLLTGVQLHFGGLLKYSTDLFSKVSTTAKLKGPQNKKGRWHNF